MVGNNTPVFFIRDPLKFQHFIRSQKRRADNNLRDHDMQWDFWTLSPESAHQVTWLMGDRGIPRTWRHMNGYSSHTYLWINAAGEKFWVKYHFKTDQGIEFFTQDEGDQMAAADTDYHQRDLYDHIAAGEFPSWTLKMQIMPFDEAKTYRFNPFDLTKVWPHGDYPLIEVGRLTLDRNLTDYHTEMEQAAFEPNNLVPGIALSPGQDAAGPRVLLLRRAPGPARRELQADPGQLTAGAGALLQQGRRHAGRQRASTRCTRPTPRAARRPTPSTTRRTTGTPTGTWSARPTPCTPQDDDWGQAGTMVREVLDDAARDRLVSQHRRPPAQRRDRAGPAAQPSSTGATWTRTSATRSRPASAPSRARRIRRPPSRPTRPARACRPRPSATAHAAEPGAASVAPGSAVAAAVMRRACGTGRRRPRAGPRPTARSRRAAARPTTGAGWRCRGW